MHGNGEAIHEGSLPHMKEYNGNGGRPARENDEGAVRGNGEKNLSHVEEHHSSRSVDEKERGVLRGNGKESFSHAEKKHNVGRPVARGYSGLPLEQTPAVVGAERGHINCEIDVDKLAYWNDPRGKRDAEFVSEYRVPEGETRYITFEPDSGGGE
uniref:Uncharacterized protein n=1 Tax=Corethron hystrix TaxID=216773 RepID=A0A7S1FL83_9STRA|mmetsp:Transcript_10069/g.22387  ORF Transcript_10069/g.22387 Transcript_10069/m.22387 type:complete len:155 (+) Transcript_10069:369-833(+)